MMRRTWWLGICGVLLLASCGGSSSSVAAISTTGTNAPTTVPTLPVAPAMGQYQVATQLNVAYGPLTNEDLDLCIPVGAAGLRPGVIVIHGGSWRKGDKSNDLTVCKILASHGFVAATIDYRLTTTSIWPAQLVDAQLAVRWLRSTAGAHQMDPQRLCSWGDSAGGHLAVFLGVLATIHPGDEASLLANEAPNTNCVADFYGPVDFTVLAVPTSYQAQVLMQLFGGVTPQQNPALYKDGSPIYDVSANSAPTLIVQGTMDTTVPPAQSQELQQKLQANGVAVQYIAYPGGHAFMGISGAQRQQLILQAVAYVIAQAHP